MLFRICLVTNPEQSYVQHLRMRKSTALVSFCKCSNAYFDSQGLTQSCVFITRNRDPRTNTHLSDTPFIYFGFGFGPHPGSASPFGPALGFTHQLLLLLARGFIRYSTSYLGQQEPF